MKQWLFLFFLLILGVSSAIGAKPSLRQDVPTTITSDRVRYFQEDQKVLFQGQVVVERPEFTLKSEKLTVLFDSEGGGTGSPAQGAMQSGAIEKIIAEGDVHLVSEGREGFCDKAVYDFQQEVITMEGDPRLVEGKNEIQGRVIRFYLAENRSEIIGGGKERVKATFFSAPEDQDE